MEIHRIWSLTRKQWLSNYRYHGGLPTMLRCAFGTGDLHSLPNQNGSSKDTVESITFSVIPRLTEFWAYFFQRALGDSISRILIGDCSGGLKLQTAQSKIEINPILNLAHGTKLDLFFSKRCNSEYVIVCDDDVFWLNSQPLEWAIQAFHSDPDLAVVSLMPRDRVSSVLSGIIEHPMGSYCLVVRREIWLREKLSFKIVYPPLEKGYDWIYDTADYANIQLVDRGYTILIAPPDIREQLIAFEGISSWLIRVQEKRGEIANVLKNVSIRQEKAYRAILVAEGLAYTILHDENQKELPLIPSLLLQRAKNICEQMLPAEKQLQIITETRLLLESLTNNSLITRKVDLAQITV